MLTTEKIQTVFEEAFASPEDIQRFLISSGLGKVVRALPFDLAPRSHWDGTKISVPPSLSEYAFEAADRVIRWGYAPLVLNRIVSEGVRVPRGARERAAELLNDANLNGADGAKENT